MNFRYLLLLILWLGGCSDTPPKEHTMDANELKAWSKALEFPSYCEEGAFEGDPNRPQLSFYALGKHSYVSAVCESFAYQKVSNIYRTDIETKQSQIVDLLQIELDLHTVSFYDMHDKPLEKPVFNVTFFQSPQLIHQSIRQFNDTVLEVVRFYDETGNCGSVTHYDFSLPVPKIISFQLQADCESDVAIPQKKWPFYAIDCNLEDLDNCRLNAL